MKRKDLEQCPDCGSKHFYREAENAEKVCAKCGLVLKESMVDAEESTIVCYEVRKSRKKRKLKKKFP